MSDPLRIVAAAIKVGDAIISMPQPARHGNILSALNGIRREYFDLKPSDYGFLTSTGKFVSRREAKRVAIEAGQLLPRHHPGDELYSECVW